MQNRPYANKTVDDLEEIFETACSSANTTALQHLHAELQFRRTPRGKELRTFVIEALVKHGVVTTNATLPSAHNKPADLLPGFSPILAQAEVKPRSQKAPSTAVKGRQPTDEQAMAIEHFNTGASLKINAYAGSGKTTTLEMIAHRTRRRGLYLAFNQNIVADAKQKFPTNINCKTTHGLAYSAIAPRMNKNKEKMAGSLTANALVSRMNIKDWRVDQSIVIGARSFAYLILETVKKFTISADKEFRIKHVPLIGVMASVPEDVLLHIQNTCVRGAQRLWQQMIDANNDTPLGHDGYLKLWALHEPLISSDFILLDEAQDTNPVLLDILKRQQSQIVFVGDRYQQIYEWRGAENAMELIETPLSSTLTCSFRFGDRIANLANGVLRLLGTNDIVRGNPNVQSRIMELERPSAILARTNVNVITEVINALQAGRRPHMVGGANDIRRMLRGVENLKQGIPTDVPEFFGFTDWNQVIAHAKTEEGRDLARFVNLVEAQGLGRLYHILSLLVEEREADVIISTAHKAKGREWSTVRLNEDFARTKEVVCPQTGLVLKEPISPSELRLLYVAITRAKEAVDVPPCIQELLTQDVGPADTTQALAAPVLALPAPDGIPKNSDVKQLEWEFQ